MIDSNMDIIYITPSDPVDKTCGGGVRSGFMLDALSKIGAVATIVLQPDAQNEAK